ncbi:hydrolase [Rhodococcus sp. RS1C4]|nr:hydrolase [Rhodococcus sp. RS1C4]
MFVHGLFANAAIWRKVVPLLAENHRCITADWPFGSHAIPVGPGGDMTATGIADVVADVIERLDLRDVTLVGNDGGGMLTQLVITRRPERIGRVVLTPCDAYENFPPPFFAYLCRLARVPITLDLIALALRVPWLRRLYGRSPIGFGWLSHARLGDELLDHFAMPILDAGIRRDIARFLRSVDKKYTLDAAEHFRDFEKPVMVAWASDDKFFPFEHAERLVSDFPNARSTMIEGSRTWVSEDRPDVVAALIDDFVRDADHVQPTATLDRSS